jgi:hypothetical protein
MRRSAKLEGSAVHLTFAGPAGKQLAAMIAAGKPTAGEPAPKAPRASDKVVI